MTIEATYGESEEINVPAEVAEKFHDVLGQHLQPVGMPAHPLLGKKD